MDVVLRFAPCGLAGILFLAMKYFTHKGAGLDWIDPAAGPLIIRRCVSAFEVVTSGVSALIIVIKRKASCHDWQAGEHPCRLAVNDDTVQRYATIAGWLSLM